MSPLCRNNRKITDETPGSFGNKFESSLRGIKYLLMRYNSINKLQVATLLKFESHNKGTVTLLT